MMLKTEGKLKAEIGGTDFSRTRHFDDQERNSRIFDPHAYHAVDVDGLHLQVQEKKSQQKNEEEMEKAYEIFRGHLLQNWNKTVEDVSKVRLAYWDWIILQAIAVPAGKRGKLSRREKLAKRLELEQFWKDQQKGSKKWWKESEEKRKGNDFVGIIPLSRYQEQEHACMKKAEVQKSLEEEHVRQLQEARALKQQQLEDQRDYERKQMTAMLRLRLKEEEISRSVKQEILNINEENQQRRQQKALSPC
ncbi:hypothetical protein O6H91_14G027600 [Diphasiastrum complanatum]|uniref:Uncharacterized protein n=1 Tax=Diphasiastrum complanatum TaxID=34168 RepID=A0ACC2BML0_DIPCM|nr:hypothetical protein O6H91_14G027600 [Diphasiastrum complanatum]